MKGSEAKDIVKREGERLTRLRRDAGLSQKELAGKLGVTQSWVSRVEKGALDVSHSMMVRALEAIEHHRVERRFIGQFQKMRCVDLMTENPIAVDPRDPASRAMRLMQDNGYSQIPVVRGNMILGMVTEQDIMKELHHDLGQISVQAVMSPEAPPIVDESAPVVHVIPLLYTYQAVLVQNQGRLTGILARADLLSLK
ncbi:MAG: CBS domain-containing protein [Candidatus Thorarchaeota archaeon]|nr:MAG: CBS domain-containing protein [Candidatus Thorarchaeota archaeon]